ncbi:MAG: FixH family protein [Endozoicomonas sp.]
MNSATRNEPFTPWYREPWVWAILGLLAVTFVWGSYRIYYAFKVQDSVVVDDYYKKGKAINQDLTRENNARDLGIQARLMIDDLTGEVRVKAEGNVSEWPDTLKLSLLSPVFADRDNVLTLRRSVSGTYVGQIDQRVEGRTYVQLETRDELIPEVGFETGWRLNQTLAIEPGRELLLRPVHLNN